MSMDEKYHRRYKQMRKFKKGILEALRKVAKTNIEAKTCAPFLTSSERQGAKIQAKNTRTQIGCLLNSYHAMLSTFGKNIQDRHWIDFDDQVKKFEKELHRGRTKKNRRTSDTDPSAQRTILR